MESLFSSLALFHRSDSPPRLLGGNRTVHKRSCARKKTYRNKIDYDYTVTVCDHLYRNNKSSPELARARVQFGYATTRYVIRLRW